MRHVLQLLILLSVWSDAVNGQVIEYNVEVVADGLNHPWSLAFMPTGEWLVTEREGRLWSIDEAGSKTEVGGVPEVFAAGQGGLFDVTLHPRFNRNRLLYLSFAAGDNKANATTIVRARLKREQLVEVTEIFAVKDNKRGPVHYGGRMAFLPDGTLLLTTGDGFDYREAAQDLRSQLGKLLRMTDAGKVPADNPFAGRSDADPYVYSYGHRNPQGLAIDSASNTIYLHEHGPAGGDELNQIEAGKNYGWPAITHGKDYSGAHVSPLTAYPGMEQPLVHWTPSIAVSGLAIYRGDRFESWHGQAIVGALVERGLRTVNLVDQTQQIVLSELGQRIRDVREGPDEALYLLTDAGDGQLLRVTP